MPEDCPSLAAVVPDVAEFLWENIQNVNRMMDAYRSMALGLPSFCYIRPKPSVKNCSLYPMAYFFKIFFQKNDMRKVVLVLWWPEEQLILLCVHKSTGSKRKGVADLVDPLHSTSRSICWRIGASGCACDLYQSPCWLTFSTQKALIDLTDGHNLI